MSESVSDYFAVTTPTPFITVVQAPGIPETERKALEKHFREALADAEYAVVVNYECRVDQIETPSGAKILVTAPGIPTTEVTKLSKKISSARKATDPLKRLVVVNYECRVDALLA